MTWLKLSDNFGDECADLSDPAFRTHVEALAWIMRKERGPEITARDIRRFAESSEVDDAIGELLAVGYWSAIDGGYRVNHHMQHQSDPEVIRKRKEADAERQRKKRRKAVGLTDEDGVTP